ncbi:MAG: type II toxin-antitoxin system VapC family toxin [Deltaproteobacteria bacterium]|nr:type II toxin-antitoxin system VapC family toxin [Deltaproteobacteria bacterium]
MNLLLDTHTFLWWITEAPQLSDKARSLIANGSNRLYWSAASSWEVAIKHALGRLPLPESPKRFLPQELTRNGIESLPITDLHALHAGQLPPHHRDPFDRMLIAQAQVESLTLLTNDPQCHLYEIETVW